MSRSKKSDPRALEEELEDESRANGVQKRCIFRASLNCHDSFFMVCNEGLLSVIKSLRCESLRVALQTNRTAYHFLAETAGSKILATPITSAVPLKSYHVRKDLIYLEVARASALEATDSLTGAQKY